MFFPLLIPNAGHTTVHNHINIDTKGIQNKLGDLTRATETNGKHLDRIATEMESEKHLITVKASDIHEAAVLAGQTLWDTREAYTTMRANLESRLTRIREWQVVKCSRKLASVRVEELKTIQQHRDAAVERTGQEWRDACNAASALWSNQTGWRIFRKPLEHFQNEAGVNRAWIAHRDAMAVPHVLSDYIHEMARIAEADLWETAHSTLYSSALARGGVLPRTCPVAREEPRVTYSEFGTKIKAYVAAMDNHPYEHARNMDRIMNEGRERSAYIDKAIGERPPELDLTDEICELAEVTRFTPNAQIQVRRSLLLVVSRIASTHHVDPNGIQKKAQV